MNREIKFRAWDDATKEMHYPEDRRHDTVLTASANILKHFDCALQYTGLKDKNGKDIYEGDIVRYVHKHKPLPIIADVRWFAQQACFALYATTSRSIYDLESDWMILVSVEIIGNIYQNPDLLK